MDKSADSTKPYCKIECQPGKHYICTCKKSNNYPYCDGNHKGTQFSPECVEVTEPKSLFVCGCEKSKNGIHCDGSQASRDGPKASPNMNIESSCRLP